MLQVAKKEHAMKAVTDNSETQTWEPSDSQQLTPSPIRQLDFGSPPPVDALKRAAHLADVSATSGDEGLDEESSEEESPKADDEIVEPIVNHDPKIISVESDDDTALSPKKIGPAERLADQPAAAHSAEPHQSMEDQCSPPRDDTLLPEPMEVEEAQLYQEVQYLADSDEEQAKRNSGTFKAIVAKNALQTT